MYNFPTKSVHNVFNGNHRRVSHLWIDSKKVNVKFTSNKVKVYNMEQNTQKIIYFRVSKFNSHLNSKSPPRTILKTKPSNRFDFPKPHRRTSRFPTKSNLPITIAHSQTRHFLPKIFQSSSSSLQTRVGRR